MQHVQQLPLVLVDPLDLHVEQHLRIELDPAIALDQRGDAFLVVMLDLHETFAEAGVLRVRAQLFELIEIADPAVADGFGQQFPQARIAVRKPAPRRHPVGDVVEFFRPELVEIVKQSLLEQAGVQRGNAVDRVAADDTEKGHAHHRMLAAGDDLHARAALVVARPAPFDLGAEPGVDLANDLERPRQQLAEQVQRPDLERLRQQRVVGVGHGAGGDVPGLLPGQIVLVDQQTHQFRDRHGRMRVVQLEAVLGLELAEIAPVASHPALQHVLQAGGDEEILLAQA